MELSTYEQRRSACADICLDIPQVYFSAQRGDLEVAAGLARSVRERAAGLMASVRRFADEGSRSLELDAYSRHVARTAASYEGVPEALGLR